MLVTPPCGASSNIALWRAKIKPPVELVVGDLEITLDKLYLILYNKDNKNKEATKRKASENGGRSNGLLNLTTKKSLNEFT